MDQLTLYIAGPMSGQADHNHPAFHAAADRLRAVGFAVVHNAVHNAVHDDTTQPWEFYMRHALRLLLDADAVAILDGWGASRGATLEVDMAKALAMPVRTVDAWVGAR